MARTKVRQDTQVWHSSIYTDTVSNGTAMETGALNIEDDLNNLRSQVNRILDHSLGGNWYDAPVRGLSSLDTDLSAVEDAKRLVRVAVLTDIAVPASQNYVVLVVGDSEAPTQVAAVALTQDGAVSAHSALNGGGYLAHELTEIAGVNAISPKNLCVVRDASNGQKIQSSGRDVFALLQLESTGSDGAAFNDTIARAKLSFVRMNAGLDDLEACPVADIENKSINYTYVKRTTFSAVLEQEYLGDNSVFIDQVGSVDVTRANAYSNQGSTPVDLTSNATLDLEGAGLVWSIRDDLEAPLFSITEGSAGGTSTVTINAATDVFDVNAVSNDFAAGVTVASSGQAITIGVTPGVIASDTAEDLIVRGTAELYLDDGNQTGSTWAQTDGIKLSDTTGEWDAFEAAFGGEVSLLSALVTAKNSAARFKYTAVVTSNIAADTNVTGAGGSPNISAQLGDYSGVGTFVDDVDVYLNGELLLNGADASANNDVYPGDSAANGDLKFEFALKGGSNPDVIQMIVYGS